MNPNRLRLIESQQTSIAKKVLAAVPIMEPWTASQILGEMTRHGGRYSMSSIEGCLVSLRDDGLVKSSGGDSCLSRMWKRVEIVDRPVRPTPPKEASMPENEEKPDLITSMARLATNLRAVADEVDELALQAMDEINKAKTGTEELRQLKALLKNALA